MELPVAYRRRQRRDIRSEGSHGRTDAQGTALAETADTAAVSGQASDTGENAVQGTAVDTLAQDTANTSMFDHNRREHASAMRNVRDHPAGSCGGNCTNGEKGQRDASGQKKKQIFDYAWKEEQQRKTEKGKETLNCRREEQQTDGNPSTEQKGKVVRKDAEKKEGRRRLQKEQRKQDGRLHFEEENGMTHGVDMRLAGRAARIAGGLAVSVMADDDTDDSKEDMGTEALHHTGRAGDKALRYTMRQSSRRMQKRDHRRGEEIPDTVRKKKSNKFYQKQKIKRAYAEARRGEKNAAGAVRTTGTFLKKTKGVLADVFRKKKGVLAAALPFLLVFLFLAAGFSGCSAIAQGVSTIFVGTTYPSEDQDIYDAEAAYREREEALNEQIGSMETTHPGYDEYRYQVDEIEHNPYQLISLLTVLYEEFTYGEIEEMDMLPVFFAEQYRLTVEEVTEIRTRTEVRMVTDPVTGEQTEQDVEVEYEWRVLCICLTNRGFDAVARLHMTQEQTALYDAYNLTYGNRSYLFDTEELPADSPAGAEYEVPAEALSDGQFARMLQEAEKYLGRAYVWGGASPETGFDCSGFVSWVINNSGNGWNVGRQTAEGLRRNCTEVSASEAKPGDLIFFQGTYNTSGASHVGIYVGNGMMIHAGNPIKYSNINTPYWQEHFMSYGRIG